MRWLSGFPLLLAACSAPTPETSRDEVERQAGPAYGPVQELQGILTTGFETSGFTRCEAKDLRSCRGPDCWFEPTEGFARRLKAVVPDADGEGGNYYLRFRGRQADKGWFGHLDAYPCQVEGIALLSAEAGLP